MNLNKEPKPTLLQTALASALVVLMYGVAMLNMDEAKREKQWKYSIDQTDSLIVNVYKKSDSIQYYIKKIDSSIAIQAANKNVRNYKEFYAWLIARDIPFAEYWTAISIAESGWSWESENARINHNFLGMSNCVFTDNNDCAEFALKWMAINPPTMEELKNKDARAYFIRRSYNTVEPLYHPRVAQIVVELQTKGLWSWN